MKYIMIFAFVFVGNMALATDQWDYCSSADGNVKIENGVLSVGEVGEIASESVKVTVLSKIKEDQEKCVLKKHKTEVISYVNTITVEEVKFAIEENGSPSKAVVICERGGSGIPANDECRK